ncbi:MAG: TRAP transporter small permease subunit [Alphaproteobacteria bacterium]|nr:TRAP transporter small permease subunit [Alphaproteobacteria bacterium]
MRAVFRLYDLLIRTLAMVAGILVAILFVLIVVDVGMRTAGLHPPIFTSAVSEYMLLYVTMFAAPWLVRERGHVRIDSFVSYAGPAAKQMLERLIILVCLILSLTAAYLSTRFAIDFWIKGTVDIRSIEIPRSFLFVPLIVGFTLCATEFLRMLVTGQPLSDPEPEHAPEFEGEI